MHTFNIYIRNHSYTYLYNAYTYQYVTVTRCSTVGPRRRIENLADYAPQLRSLDLSSSPGPKGGVYKVALAPEKRSILNGVDM